MHEEDQFYYLFGVIFWLYHARFRVALLWHSVVTLLQVLHSVKHCYIFLHSVPVLHSVT